MKRLAAVALLTVVLLPGVAFASSATDAALGLGAFAVFNQILGGVGIFGAARPVVVAPAPVVVAPPPPVYAAPAPVYYAPPRPVYYAPPRPVYVAPAPVYVAPRPVVVYRKVHPHAHWRHHHADHWRHR
jgi:PXPV repeat (3 copies)